MIPTPSSTRMKIESPPATENPCSAIARTVGNAKPAMNTSAAPSTSRRVMPQGPRGSAGASCRDAHSRECSPVARGRPQLACAAHREQPDREQAEGEAADMGEVGDAFPSAERAREPREAKVELLEEPEPEQQQCRYLDDRDEEDDEDQAEDAGTRIQQDVA